MLRLHRSFYHGLMARAFLLPAMAPVRAVIDALLGLARRFTTLADTALALNPDDVEQDASYRRALLQEVSALQQALTERTHGLRTLLERSEGKELALRLRLDEQQGGRAAEELIN